MNDRYLFLIDNTISALDALSRGLMPGLSRGCCVVTGAAFELQMVIQADRFSSEKQPASEDVELQILWSDEPRQHELVRRRPSASSYQLRAGSYGVPGRIGGVGQKQKVAIVRCAVRENGRLY